MPLELKALPQWVGWRFVWREGKPGEAGKWTKAPKTAPPINPEYVKLVQDRWEEERQKALADGKPFSKRRPNGEDASSTESLSWATFEQAKAAFLRGGFDGIGFVFSHEDQYFGVDLDACRDKKTGQLTPEAQEWITRFGTYCEVSPSGTGVKLIGLGALPEGMSGRRNATTGAECYDRGRYFTVTGQRLPESPESCSGAPEVLTAFLAHHFPKREAAPVSERSHVQPLDMDDYELLAKANGAKDGAKFAALWSGSHAGLPGASEADMALAGLLLFWTQGDQARTEAMMRRSGLAREKWDTMRGSQTYLALTIAKAADGKTEFYQPAGVRSNNANFANFANPSYRGEREEEEEEEEELLSKSTNYANYANSPEWNCDPLPFGQETLPVFPSWALPSHLRDFAEQVAASVGTAPDLPGVQVLAAVAAATQKRVAVTAKRGYVEPLTLWCIGIAPPGSRKSAIMGHVRKPFTAHEAKENQKRAGFVAEFESKERIARGALAKAEAAAIKGDSSDLKEARESLQVLVENPVRPLRLLADDATPEVLAMMLSENEGRLAVLDAEGAAFGHMIGRYSQNPAIEIFLKGHSGEDHTTDRAGGSGTARRTVSVRQAALTIGCAVQPEVLAELRKKKELAGRGALARCLFSFSEDTDAADEFDTPDLDEQVLADYWNLISELLTLTASQDIDDDGQPIPYMVGLAEEARVLFTDFYREVQQERRAEGSGLFCEWLAKLHGATLRIAGVLHMAEHGKPGAERPISSQTMQGAIELGKYFSAHAQAALARIREDEATEGALRILAWVKRNAGKVSEAMEKGGGLSVRDLRTHLRTFETNEEMQSALFVLASRGHARELPVPERPAGTRGPKPTAKWQFHPSLVWSVEV
jgi:hypothetical protein